MKAGVKVDGRWLSFTAFHKPLDSYAIRVGILTWVRGGKTKVRGDISTV